MENKHTFYYLVYMHDSKVENLVYALKLLNDDTNTAVPLSKAVKEQPWRHSSKTYFLMLFNKFCVQRHQQDEQVGDERAT